MFLGKSLFLLSTFSSCRLLSVAVAVASTVASAVASLLLLLLLFLSFSSSSFLSQLTVQEEGTLPERRSLDARYDAYFS